MIAPVIIIRGLNIKGKLTVNPNIKKKRVRIRNADSLVISLNRSIPCWSLSTLRNFLVRSLAHKSRLFNINPKNSIINKEDKWTIFPKAYSNTIIAINRKNLMFIVVLSINIKIRTDTTKETAMMIAKSANNHVAEWIVNVGLVTTALKNRIPSISEKIDS